MTSKTLCLRNLATMPERRLHDSFLAKGERRLLVSIAERLPGWTNADHLTILGFTAQIMTGVAYALARSSPKWLLMGAGLLVVNWLGDSLDGTLARVRQQLRPRYGFYVDHMLDSLGAVALMAGLAVSGYMAPIVAVTLLVLFLLLSIQSYLATYALDEFRLSFWGFGPTELRAALVAGNLALLRWPTVGARYRLFDVGGTIGAAMMTTMLAYFGGRNIYRLYQLERIR